VLIWQNKLYVVAKQALSSSVTLFIAAMLAYASSSPFRSSNFYHSKDVMKQNLRRNLSQ